MTTPKPTYVCAVWNPWSDKSENISFRAKPGGPGELKVGGELETQIGGQNKRKDLYKLGIDVKSLDRDNSFNTGADGRDASRQVRSTINALLLMLPVLSKSSIFTEPEQKLMKKMSKYTPDEFAAGTITLFEKVCNMLSAKRNDLDVLPMITVSYMGVETKVRLDEHYQMCKLMKRPLNEEYSKYEETIQTLFDMDHEYVRDPSKLRSDLDSLTDMFRDGSIVVANEKKGYMHIAKSQINFNRITRGGNPRFRVKF
jgi:hypothetical protein